MKTEGIVEAGFGGGDNQLDETDADARRWHVGPRDKCRLEHLMTCNNLET